MNELAILNVQAKIVGQKPRAASGWQVPLPPETNGADRMKLRDLITYVVVQEVQAFRERQEERRLARLLTPEQIAAGAERGKIDLGERDLKQNVDEQAAIVTALQAFEDGLYYVFFDDVQQERLDQEVVIQNGSRLLFVRLVALAGG